MILLSFIAAALAYGAATFAYGIDAGQPRAQDQVVSPLRRRARPVLAFAAVAHTVLIGLQCVDGDHPLKNIFLATSFGSLIAVIGYLALSRTQKIDALGAVVGPVALGGLALGVVFSSVNRAHVPAGSTIASAHVGFASAGLAGFTLAAAVAGLYLATERRLRTKQFRPGQAGMSLTGLDRLHHRLVLLVTPVFTLAIVTGALWILQIGGPHMIRGRAFELAAAAIAWAASVALLVMRAVWGSRGRQSAWLTIVAFAAVVLIVVSYGVRV
jgi:ABC-type transport system involved in cytochrome c biogenesis permease subunit